MDDSYKSFVWSLIVQQPTVKVGVVPTDASIEVYIPRKTRSQKLEDDDNMDAVPPKLELIPGASSLSLAELTTRYGESLRIAVDSETSFAAITGSRVRVSHLSSPREEQL